MNLADEINSLFTSKVYASSLGDTLNEKLSEIEGGTNIQTQDDLIKSIVGIAVPLSVICVVLLVVYAGYILMTSQGNPDKLKEGKEVLTNAIIGFVVILLSVAILMLISNAFGLNIYE